MAGACPCGCGRLVRFNASCMAKRAVYISSLLIVAERMRDRAGPGLGARRVVQVLATRGVLPGYIPRGRARRRRHIVGFSGRVRGVPKGS